MVKAKTLATDGGFIARVTFQEDSACNYSPNGHPIVEMRYQDCQEDLHEFIDFMVEHEEYICDATVLFANGTIIDARSLPAN